MKEKCEGKKYTQKKYDCKLYTKSMKGKCFVIQEKRQECDQRRKNWKTIDLDVHFEMSRKIIERKCVE